MRVAFLATLMVSVCLCTARSWGQGVGTVVGRVVDSTGAVVAAVTVTVTNVGTNVAIHTKTTSTGDYAAPYLRPGVYRVIVEAPGFKKAEVNGITLQVDQTVRADVALKPGAVSQTVSVNAGALALDTDSATIGQVITERQIVDLPMVDRSFLNLLVLGPGANETTPNGVYNAQLRDNNIDVGGARSSSIGFLIDGMTNTEPHFTQIAVKLSLDAIQEFKEQGSTYSAEYGESAAQVNLTTKSGTNSLHGTLFEFLRNDAFDAHSYFDVPGSKLPPLRQNDYGYSLGGPVYIPKIYDGRNRTFFFANFERLKSSTGFQAYGTTYTPDELQGLITSAVPVLDPSTGLPFAQDSSGRYVIPKSDWSRMATVALRVPGSYMSIPNLTTPVNGNNYVHLITDPAFDNQQTYRIDQTLHANDDLSARFTLTNSPQTSNAAYAYGASINEYTNQTWNVIETHTFSPNLVNQARVGWLHYFYGLVGPPAPAADISALGMTNTFDQSGAVFPTFGITNVGGGGGAFQVPNTWHERIWNGADSVSWIHGRHSYTLGFLAYRSYEVFSDVAIILGSYSFDGSGTAPTGVAPSPGNAWADFLLGDLSAGGDQANVPSTYGLAHKLPVGLYVDQSKYAGYVNDNWKPTDRLTLTMGLRYDFQSTPYEENHRQLWRDVTAAGGGLCSADKSLIASGVGGPYYKYCQRSTPKKPFAPRVGFAYRPFSDETTVVRGGYGIYFDQNQTYEFSSGITYPYVLNYNPRGQFTNNLFLPQSPTTTPAELGSLYNLEPPYITNPYVEQWSLSVERELDRNSKLTMAYVGAEGTHLEGRLTSSQPTSYDPANPAAGYPFYNFGTYGQNGTPFAPGYVLEGAYDGSSNYNALQASVEHRDKNLLLLAAYTWASSMDDNSSASGVVAYENNGWAGPMDAHNIHLDYSKSSYDVNQRLVVSAVYELPVGRGRQFGSGVNKAAQSVIGGWQVNGIYSAQSGIPYAVACPDIGSALQSFGQRCNQIASAYPRGFHRSLTQWFDTASYTQPAIGVFGNEHRNSLRAPGINNLDFSLFKNFSFADRLTAQIRAEAFNAANHPQFGEPSANMGASNFGGVSSTVEPGRIIQLAAKVIF